MSEPDRSKRSVARFTVGCHFDTQFAHAQNVRAVCNYYHTRRCLHAWTRLS